MQSMQSEHVLVGLLLRRNGNSFELRIVYGLDELRSRGSLLG